MSSNDFAPDLGALLDRFDVPPPRDGFTDRIVAAVITPSRRRASQDRRGRWKFAQRSIVGTVAAAMVSAAAVASGLLGAAGIRVPVLTAMLAPEPVAKPVVAQRSKPVVRPIIAPKPAVPLPALSEPDDRSETDAMPPRLAERATRRAERRAARRAFMQQNPDLVPVIKQAVQQERAFVQANPAVRELRRMPRAERRAYLAERPELVAAIRARQAERRAFRAANPQAEAAIRARIQQRRPLGVPAPGVQAPLTQAPIDSAGEGKSEPQR